MKKTLQTLLFALIAIMMPIGASAQIDDYITVDTEVATATIDGTLGGKATATEDDITALVEQLKAYVDNGITKIIVTGSQPAKFLTDGYLIPVVSLAFERLTSAYWGEKIDSYWGQLI